MVDYYLEYRMKRLLLLGALLLGLLGAFVCWKQQKREQTLQREIASEVIRFHVKANSDREEDQALKLAVRDELLRYLHPLLEDSDGIEQSRTILKERLKEIVTVAQDCIKEKGFKYEVKASLVMDEFPQKVYGDCTFPAGVYEALRVDIGKAEGHNWWCMVYPGLCFTEESGAYVSEESKEMLKHVLTEEEFELVTKERKIKIRLKLLDFLNE